VIFHSYVSLPEGNHIINHFSGHLFPRHFSRPGLEKLLDQVPVPPGGYPMRRPLALRREYDTPGTAEGNRGELVGKFDVITTDVTI
jgi:hypothetical protein